ncbi:MAG TPA: tRNA adenosine deaminase-associated protein [Mycobacteriales bacterium]|nr:tRNA adenosine deaminase-associated protein [Mycobacteriales bacterium]
MSYFAAALARTPDGWTARELDLDGAADVDEVADRVRDLDGDAVTTLLFVEEDDEYLAILRLDADADEPRVFVSDAHAADSYPVAEIFTVAIEDPALGAAPEDDPPGRDSEPLGDAGLLADLGTSRRELIALVQHEGTLPADVITEVCERAGCVDELEELRGA